MSRLPALQERRTQAIDRRLSGVEYIRMCICSVGGCMQPSSFLTTRQDLRTIFPSGWISGFGFRDLANGW